MNKIVQSITDHPCPWKLIISGELTLLTPLNVGGTNDSKSINKSFARDGASRPTVKGEAFAGAIVASARKIHPIAIPEGLSSGPDAGSNNGILEPSIWTIEHAHPTHCNEQSFVMQDGIAIHPKTNAAKEQSIHSTETIVEKYKFPVIITINLEEDQDLEVTSLICTVLALWQDHHGWCGAQASRGLGCIKWQPRTHYLLSAANFRDWPNASRSYEDTLALWESQLPEHIEKFDDVSGLVKFWYLTYPGKMQQTRSATLLTEIKLHFSLTQKNENKEDTWGYDPFAIGSKQAGHVPSNNLMLPDGVADLRSEENKNYFDPDCYVKLDYSGQPIITASAIRSALKRAFKQHTTMTDEECLYLFGSDDKASPQSGHIFPLPATVTDENWKLAWLHSHSEDEFTAGAFDKEKFDKVIVVAGEWQTSVYLESDSIELTQRFAQILTEATDFLELGNIAIGGGVNNGLGRIKWQINKKEPVPLSHKIKTVSGMVTTNTKVEFCED